MRLRLHAVDPLEQGLRAAVVTFEFATEFKDMVESIASLSPLRLKAESRTQVQPCLAESRIGLDRKLEMLDRSRGISVARVEVTELILRRELNGLV